MEDKILFKITNSDRSARKIISCFPKLEELLKAASNKQITGTKVVLENDGFDVDEDILLTSVKENHLMLLKDSESWTPPQDKNDIFNIINDAQNASTVSSPLSSTDFSSNLSILSNHSGSSSNIPLISHIPWEKFSKPVLDTWNEGKTLTPALTTELVHTLVNIVRENTTNITIPLIRRLVEKLIEKYPETFLEKDSVGNIISAQNCSLIIKIMNRNNYLNRQTETSEHCKPNIPFCKRRRSSKFAAVCANWQPIELEDDSIEMQRKQKKALQNLSAKHVLSSQELNFIRDEMKSCYSSLRLFLNNMKANETMDSITREWPFIFKAEVLFDHFYLLTKQNIVNCNNIPKMEKIINFVKCKNKDYNSNLLPSLNATIDCICDYFKEDNLFLYRKYKIGTSKEDIDPPGATPWIAVVETEVCSAIYVYCEKSIVNDTIRTFDDAIFYLFGLYFVFNLIYPKEVSQSLEFYQRFFCGIQTDSVRGQKRQLTNLAKVFNLMRKLK